MQKLHMLGASIFALDAITFIYFTLNLDDNALRRRPQPYRHLLGHYYQSSSCSIEIC